MLHIMFSWNWTIYILKTFVNITNLLVIASLFSRMLKWIHYMQQKYAACCVCISCQILVIHVINKCLSHTCGVKVDCPCDKHKFNHTGNALSNTFGRKFFKYNTFFALEFVLYVDRGLGLNISKYSNILHAWD